MTFINLINQLKKQYPTNNQLVILTVIFSLSSKVKNKLDFTKFRHHQIDFSYDELIKKLDDYFLKHKPLGQIVHTTKFCKLTIDIYLHIFEPRSETELITDQIINYLKKHRDLKYGIDLCCGTGCIGLAIKKHCDWVDMTCVDINHVAINNTKHNAKLNQLKIKSFVDDFHKILKNKKMKFDFITCNPPYVDIKKLDKRMLKYETKISFNNSNNHTYFYDALIKHKDSILNPHGKIFLESPNYQLIII